MNDCPSSPACPPFERSKSLPLLERPRRLSDLLVNLVHARRGSFDFQQIPPPAPPLPKPKELNPTAAPVVTKRGNQQVHAVDTEVYHSLELVLGKHVSSSPLLPQKMEDNDNDDNEEDESLLPAPPPLKNPDPVVNCFICLGRFTTRHPSSEMPCGQCKNTLVHLKCMYEWKSAQENSTCPLCRSELLPFEYTPPDPLFSSSLFMYSARKAFVSRPVKKELGMIRCYIRVVGVSSRLSQRTPNRYELYLQAPTSRKYPAVPLPPNFGQNEGDQLLMVATKTSLPWAVRSKIDVFLNHPPPRKSRTRKELTLATLQAGSWLGLDYTLLAPVPLLGSTKMELCSVRFEQNRVGSGQGPRRIAVCLPKVQEDLTPLDPWPPCLVVEKEKKGEINQNEEEEEEEEEDPSLQQNEVVYKTVEHRPATKKDSLKELLKKSSSTNSSNDDECIVARNRKPYYLESISAFSLDFFGRVTLPSNKNFLLTAAVDSDAGDDQSGGGGAERNMLLFGKIGARNQDADVDVYTLDFQYPLSPLQAFGIALASCDRKLGCA